MLDIAIDVGSGITKVCAGDVREHFPSLSGIAATTSGFELQAADGALVSFDGKEYVVGQRAKSLVHPDKLANTRSDRWFDQDAYMALMYAAMAKGLPANYSGKLALCTGLPQATYGAHKDALRDKLARKHSFSVNGERYTVHLRRANLYIMPQVMGLFLSRLARRKSLQVQQVGLIDVGTYTSDWTVVEECSIAQWASGGIAVGVANVIQKLSDYLRTDLKMNCADATVSEALRSGEIRVGNQTIDLSDRIEQYSLQAGGKMVDAIRKQWRGAKDFQIIVGGGGGPLFAPVIGVNFPHAEVINDRDPIYSVVDGYHAFIKQCREQRAA